MNTCKISGLNDEDDVKTELRKGEEIIKEGAANLQKGAETVGGKLYLTNQRLVFEAHKLNFQGGQTEIELKQVQTVTPCWTKLFNVLPVAPNSLAVAGGNGLDYRFVLNGRKKWAQAIESAKP